MPLGMAVDLGLRDIVFDVDPATLRKKGISTHPIYGPCLLWPNGWMDEDAAWYESRPRHRPHCTRRGPSSRERGTIAPPLFSAHVYCGHGRPSQLLLSSCFCMRHVYDFRVVLCSPLAPDPGDAMHGVRLISLGADVRRVCGLSDL